MACIPCITWVKRGVAKEVPDKVQLEPEELAALIKQSKDTLGFDDDDEEMDQDVAATLNKGKKRKKKKEKEQEKKSDEESDDDRIPDDDDDDDIVKAYGLDDYDNEDEGDGDPLSIGGLTFYASNADDPYITLKDKKDVSDDEEDMKVKPTDNLLVLAKAQEEFCNLQIFVYNESEGELFGHHDIYLPAFPLAVEWLNFDPSDDKPGNLVAVGSMEPTIDIWDLDIMESIEPALTLGTKTKKKKSKKKGAVGGHSDAVLDLSWNHHARNVLASASADHTVALWDIGQASVVTTLTQHTEKVQSLQWHPFEPQSLLSGGFDKQTIVYDCRSPNATHRSWHLAGEVERVAWDHFNPFYFLASTDQGNVYYVDTRQDKPVFTLSAHSEAVTGLSLSSQVNGCLVTASTDKTVKVWDIIDAKPTCVTEKPLKLGEIQCASCCPESGFVFAVSGEREFRVWDIRDSADVRSHFEGRSSSAKKVSVNPELQADAMDALDDLSIDTDSANTGTKSAKSDHKTNSFAQFNATSTDTTTSTSKKKKKKKKNKPK